MKNTHMGSIKERSAFHGGASQEQPEPLQWLQNLEQQQQEGSVGDPDDANQQQQQQTQESFANISEDDLELMPQNVRDAVTKAKQEYKQLKGDVTAAKGMQSQFDKQQAEIQRLQGELQKTTNTAQPKVNADPIAAMLEEQYRAQGFDDATVKNLVKVNTPIMKAMRENIVQEVGTQFAPMANVVTETRALDAFNAVRGNDSLGWSQIPEVQQRLWERTQQMQQSGELVNVPLLDNLAKIFWAEHIQKHGFPSQNETQHEGSQPPRMNIQPIPNMNNGNSNGNGNAPAFNYPGSSFGGHAPMSPNRPSANGMAVDPDTRAALAATMNNWPVKPKAFRASK